ncbi:flippase [Methanolobus sp. ZRKC3]|uniref:flippase n=1 Tax=Methanolobus sp. ZRKC3 TaxID=3125786 RepID=UPI00324315EA
MSTIKNIAKNTSILILGNLSFRIISFFVTIQIARYLGSELFGVYNFVFAYLAFFNITSDLGMQFIIVREMSQEKDMATKIIGNAYIIRLFLTVLSMIVAISIASLTDYPFSTKYYIYIASLTVFFISFSDFYSTIFQTNLKMQYNIYSKLAYRILSAILILFVIYLEKPLIYVIYSLVVSEIVKLSLNYTFSKKFLKPNFGFDRQLCKYMLLQSLPLALSSSIQIIHNKVDIIMLSFIKANADIGIYSAAYRLSEPVLFITFALTASIFPIMASSFKDSTERMIKTYYLSVKYLLIVMLPIVIVISSTSSEIIELVYGVEFIEASKPLSILVWSLVIISFNSVMSNMLIAAGQQKIYTLSTLISAIVNIMLNMILIPIWSYNGASIATVISNSAFFLVSFYYISRNLYLFPVSKIVNPILCGCAMIITLNVLQFSIILSVLTALIVYILALFATKSLDQDDINIIRKITSRQ